MGRDCTSKTPGFWLELLGGTETVAMAEALASAHFVVKETGDGPEGRDVGDNIYGCGVEVPNRL